jgi:structural maintenance of chromosome 4
LEKITALVEQLSEERNEKLNRVKIVEREKEDLEGPMKEAVAYVKVENEMTKIRNVVCQKYMYVLGVHNLSFLLCILAMK